MLLTNHTRNPLLELVLVPENRLVAHQIVLHLLTKGCVDPPNAVLAVVEEEGEVGVDVELEAGRVRAGVSPGEHPPQLGELGEVAGEVVVDGLRGEEPGRSSLGPVVKVDEALNILQLKHCPKCYISKGSAHLRT